MAQNELEFLQEQGDAKQFVDLAEKSQKAMSSAQTDEEKIDIMQSTLSMMGDFANATKEDLLEKLRDLEDFESEFGTQFASLTKFTDKEMGWISKAESKKKEIEAQIAKIEQWGDGFWSTVVKGKERKLTRLNVELESATKNIETQTDNANLSKRKRLNESNITELFSVFEHKCSAIIRQIGGTVKELGTNKASNDHRFEEANKIFQAATQKLSTLKGEMQQTEAQLVAEENKLSTITPNTPAAATQMKVVQTIEQKLEELKSQEKVATTIANDKEGFLHKHNMSNKTMTAQIGALKTYQANLTSALTERKVYYKNYEMMLKASNDQEVSSILEEFGTQTDMMLAEDIVRMYNAVQNDLFDLLQKHPERMGQLYGFTSTLAKSISKFSKINDQVRKNMEQNYGQDINDTFSQTYDDQDIEFGSSAGDNPLDGRINKDEPTSPSDDSPVDSGGSDSPSEMDLLG